MSRLEALIEKLESGERLTQDDLLRTAQLQALDLVRAGELFIEERLKAEDEADEQFRKLLADASGLS